MGVLPRDRAPRKQAAQAAARIGLALTLALSGLAALGGCATSPPASDPQALSEYRSTDDPLEPTNRLFYRVNDALDGAILRPVAVAYRSAVPQPVRDHTHDFLVNLSNPVTLADDMLQGKPRRAGDTFMRLLINTTVGLGGIFDVAEGWGWPQHDTDFGVTLALWGAGDGPYLFLPLFGPSNARDAVGIGGDLALDPFNYVGRGTTVTALYWSRFGVSAVDARSRHIDDIDTIKRTALDPYATFRSLYQQHRAAQVAQTRADNRHTVPAWFPQPAPAPAAATTPSPNLGLGTATSVK
jgi:phospholipid-binding lipoprotein MlaA